MRDKTVRELTGSKWTKRELPEWVVKFASQPSPDHDIVRNCEVQP